MSDYSKHHSRNTSTITFAGGDTRREQGGFRESDGVPSPMPDTDERTQVTSTVGGVGGGVSLGNTAGFASTALNSPSEHRWARRLERYFLKGVSRNILISERVERVSGGLESKTYSNPRYRVCECLRVTHNRKDNVVIDVSPSRGTYHYANLRVCGCLWQCPVCAAKISEKRRQELSMLVERARALGCSTFMMTFTLSHHLGDPLDDLLTKLNWALRAFKSGRSYDDFKKTYKIIGSVRAIEHTTGRNGWHPHSHALMISELPVGAIDYGAMIEYAKARWRDCLINVGLDASWEHGLDIGFKQGHVDDYLAKFGIESSWTDAHEITKQNSKVSRSAGGLTPFGLLQAHAAGESVFGQSPARLFLEYVEATYGNKQLFWSAGLRKRFALGAEQTDKELAQLEPDDRQLAMLVDLIDWSIILRYQHDGRLLNILEQTAGDIPATIAFINHLRQEHLG